MHKESASLQVNCHKSYTVYFVGPPTYDHGDCNNNDGTYLKFCSGGVFLIHEIHSEGCVGENASRNGTWAKIKKYA